MGKKRNRIIGVGICLLALLLIMLAVVAVIASQKTGRSFDECFFGACCGALYVAGMALGFSYKEICVIVNIYIHVHQSDRSLQVLHLHTFLGEIYRSINTWLYRVLQHIQFLKSCFFQRTLYFRLLCYDTHVSGNCLWPYLCCSFRRVV